MSFSLYDMAEEIARKKREENPPTIVYRIRDKETGEFIGGGHGTQNGIYSTLKGLRSSLKTSWKGYYKHNRKCEIVECEVVAKRIVETIEY